jgi:hypothetical protein
MEQPLIRAGSLPHARSGKPIKRSRGSLPRLHLLHHRVSLLYICAMKTGERQNMRMMLKIVIPTEIGNQAIKNGSLHKIFEATMSKLKPEAAYFVAENGLRSAMMFFDMKDASEIPVIAEPLFAGLNARLQLLPVMNADDLKKGLDIAKQAM